MTTLSDVHVWRCDTRSLHRSRSAPSALSPSERRRSALLRRPDVQRDFVEAHGALRQILADWTGIAATELRFDTRCAYCGDSVHGRPVIANEVTPAAPFFNLSRRDGLAVIAVSEVCAVGVDVEAAGPREKWDLIGGQVFTDVEASTLRALGPDAAATAASRWWTRKEALSKAVGLGLALPFEQLAVGAWSACGWIRLRLEQTACDQLAAPIPVGVRDVQIAPGYAAAVSVAGTEDDVSLLLHDVS